MDRIFRAAERRAIEEGGSEALRVLMAEHRRIRRMPSIALVRDLVSALVAEGAQGQIELDEFLEICNYSPGQAARLLIHCGNSDHYALSSAVFARSRAGFFPDRWFPDYVNNVVCPNGHIPGEDYPISARGVRQCEIYYLAASTTIFVLEEESEERSIALNYETRDVNTSGEEEILECSICRANWWAESSEGFEID